MRLVERFYAFMGHPWPPPLHGDPPTLGGWSLTAGCLIGAGGPLPGLVVWLPLRWARSTESGRARQGNCRVRRRTAPLPPCAKQAARAR